MMLKGKRAGSLLAKDSAEKSPPDEIVSEEEVDTKEPYMVFDTESDYEKAIEGEISKRDKASAKPVDDADQRRGRLVSLWQRDAAMLKLIVPEFDLEAALKNEVFVHALAEGGSVFEAYKAAIKPISASGRNEILQNGQSAGRGTGDATANPARLSSEDFKRYIENIRNS